MIHQIIDFILVTVSGWGYLGIFALMLIESSFIPFPSEVVIIPAGYLAYKGEMSMSLVIASGVAGSLAGAFINYFLAMFLGRRILHKYGKYFFLHEHNLNKVEDFFRRHGSFSTFFGRLIPMIRQLISIPAGLARMNLIKFTIYTGLGAAIWVIVLAMLGYILGQNQELISQYLHNIIAATLALIAVAAVIYIKIYKKKSKNL